MRGLRECKQKAARQQRTNKQIEFVRSRIFSSSSSSCYCFFGQAPISNSNFPAENKKKKVSCAPLVRAPRAPFFYSESEMFYTLFRDLVRC